MTAAGTAAALDALPAYDEVIDCLGIRVPFVPGIVTPAIERPMRNSRYEKGECLALRAMLQPGDRVLELGAGVGLLSTVAALVPGVEAVTAVEANPGLIPMIRETHRLNGAAHVDLLNAVVTGGDGAAATLPFYLRHDFWASSMEPASRPYEAVAEVPCLAFAPLLARTRATVIVCDIEGAELGLFAGADLSGVRAVVVELHPKVYGDDGLRQVEAALIGQGLLRQPGFEGSSVQLFARPARLPADGRPWPPVDPRVLIATCMKDEGPFILEWIAWHRALGVTDFVIFTNDCTDGTDRLLDRLDEIGVVRHLPNPALATGTTYFQPAALKYLPHLRQFRDADFVISMDVDEFVNIRVGAGRLADLFATTGPFDVLSMFEINHGSNRREGYERGWVTDLFPLHETERPGQHKGARGVKSIVRTGPAIAEVRNHRPDLAEGRRAVWLDGSGRPLAALAEDRGLNGTDCRGTYDLVSLDHFPLRSLDSYLVKMFRGDVVIAGKRVSNRYWRLRNRNDEATVSFARNAAAARAEYDRLLGDAAVARLHDAACAAHEARIADLLARPDFAERRAWVLAEAW